MLVGPPVEEEHHGEDHQGEEEQESGQGQNEE